jgi:chemotaxis protein MotA
MAWSTAAGLILAFACLIISNLLEHGNPLALLNAPAAVIVFGGTLGSALVSFPPERTLSLPKTIMTLFKGKMPAHADLIKLLVELADKARRQGLLALEEEEARLTEPFMRKGVQLVVDGVDPSVVRELLEIDSEHMSERHASNYALLAAMGGYAPTMGMIGTVMGLVNVLGSMEDPSKLAAAIATAFLATFYGVATANLIWLPLSSKLKQASAEEMLMRSIITEGVLAIQSGDNPRIVSTRLESYLSPKHRTTEQRSGSERREPATEAA